MGYEYHLDSALVKSPQDGWQNLQDLILNIKSKHTCLMSLMGLLALTEKVVREGCLHMRPFKWHLKENWKFTQSVYNLLSWSETISTHLDFWQNPLNVLKGSDLHPKDHSIQTFIDVYNLGWDAHLDQDSIKGLWSDGELELKAVFSALKHFRIQCQNQTVLIAMDSSTSAAYKNK